MKRFLFIIMIMALGCLVILPRPSFSAVAYVTDSFKITLRSGPSTNNRILSLLSSGQPLEVIETQGDWSHVRVLGKGKPAPEGWVLSRYVIERLPWKKQAEALRTENASLKAKLSQAQQEIMQLKQSNEELSKELQDIRRDLKDVTRRYNSLKAGASEYLKLKKKFSEVKAELDKSEAAINRLTKENNEYKYSEKKKWFALGALVLLCGLLIGIIIGRQQRKRRSYLY